MVFRSPPTCMSYSMSHQDADLCETTNSRNWVVLLVISESSSSVAFTNCEFCLAISNFQQKISIGNEKPCRRIIRTS